MKKNWIFGGILFFLLAIGLIFSTGYYEKNTNAVGVQPAAAIVPQLTNGTVADVAGLQTPEPAPQPTVGIQKPDAQYIQIVDACNYAHVGTCVNVRSGPGLDYPVVLQLRNGIVLKVAPDTVSADGYDWYKVEFEDDVRYPERITSSWYVAKDDEAIQEFTAPSEIDLDPNATVTTNKKIVVDLSDQMLYAYDGDTLFMQESISSGIEDNPTVPGTFQIYKKTPSRYMQGPLPGETTEYYDLPGVAWDMYFTQDGAVLHAAYWHNNFGHPMSHGCINQSPENAQKLYAWADVGTPVIVQQ